MASSSSCLHDAPELSDNSGAVLGRIAGLFRERTLADVVLVVGGVEYPCHRIILCASSDVFQVTRNRHGSNN